MQEHLHEHKGMRPVTWSIPNRIPFIFPFLSWSSSFSLALRYLFVALDIPVSRSSRAWLDDMDLTHGRGRLSSLCCPDWIVLRAKLITEAGFCTSIPIHFFMVLSLSWVGASCCACISTKRLNHLCSQLYSTVSLLYTCHTTSFGYI
jgi:hypothetical protein